VSAEFVFATNPNALRYTFNEDVQASLSTGDVAVRTVPGDAAVALANLTYDATANTAVLTFSGVLPNGNYRATLTGAGVQDRAGNALAADNVLDFYYLAGDINRDRAVDSSDFSILATNFGRAGQSYANGDLNGDGRVDSSDFSILASNFGQRVPAPAPMASSLVSSVTTATLTATRPTTVTTRPLSAPSRRTPVRPQRTPAKAAWPLASPLPRPTTTPVTARPLK
jgi:hypothetical protein